MINKFKAHTQKGYGGEKDLSLRFYKELSLEDSHWDNVWENIFAVVLSYSWNRKSEK